MYRSNASLRESAISNTNRMRYLLKAMDSTPMGTDLHTRLDYAWCRARALRRRCLNRLTDRGYRLNTHTGELVGDDSGWRIVETSTELPSHLAPSDFM